MHEFDLKWAQYCWTVMVSAGWVDVCLVVIVLALIRIGRDVGGIRKALVQPTVARDTKGNPNV